MQTITSFINTYPVFVTSTIISVAWLMFTWLTAVWFRWRLSRQPIPRDQPDDQQQSRFWQHALHEERNISDRSNFFVIFQSVLLGVVATLYTRLVNMPTLLILFALLGLAISLIWAFIQARHKFVVDSMLPRLKAYFPEYVLTLQWRRRWPLPDGLLTTYVIPTLVVVIWLVLVAAFERVNLFGVS